ncbi:MAG: hypothetical protein JSW47_13985 [Phycisphaerales bacterium]|nr:MAG: hypothetical protein JSW47_13985 [Phycisphaerales bacterium]UCF15488.1 MAG: hypothetical protein JSW59_18975 [Phycisphaerales bacterium]
MTLFCVFALFGCKKQHPTEQVSSAEEQERVAEAVKQPEIEVSEGETLSEVDHPEPPESAEEPTATAESSDNKPAVQMLPMRNQDVLELTAKDVVQVMRQAGFSETQIYEHGTAVRDAMAGSGAVQVKIDGVVEAVFAAKGDSVYISTRTKGHFIYNVRAGWQNSQRR